MSLELPHDVKTVLREMARQLCGEAIRPDTIAKLDIDSALEGHAARIEHVPRSAKGMRPRTWPHYVLTIHGKRTDGRWRFRPTELAALLRKSGN